jgi:hypothetical protein
MNVIAKYMQFVVLVALAALSASCGEFTRQGQAPTIVVVKALQAASGASPQEFGGTLLSDVVTDEGGTFNDLGEVEMTLVSKDPGVGSGPSALNSVTVNRYRVTYTRTDGRNREGTDVPYAFDSALTFTVPNDGTAKAGFQIVRNTAKWEAPLRALAFNDDFIHTIAEVTFYGRDQAGNEVIASGRIGIDFANWADPK